MYNYFPVDIVKKLHKKTVQISGGGDTGIRDLGILEGALAHIQNDLYYPTFEKKLTHLFFCANKFHTFNDGNKRIAIVLGAQFLLLNGYLYMLDRFIRDMENISYHVASGKIDKELLEEIITSMINEVDFSEELKLKIFNAIS
ncbi:type II toxin-antitoxin system death-on-curing family toxin [Ilyobacter polytropus]|uniref:Death-on-curing family protein n=1 Tax=Ilyobacter polytropus (strain ATCC 51220 / DSM 2926 / LMG 16218 / CuHBu1) TaxID=572544 RepID=E3HBS9_ILYPC|nr:type II toxin-antitoxin system death-on-curing family toxin [Ilyobacter polytropus]ADO83841.1 death-on-curing family protein [Ilyobacter polytropus DSM 2926]